jgi:hypothetical protein
VPSGQQTNPLESYPNRDWEGVYRDQYSYDDSFTWVCSPNDTHACRLRSFVKNGVVLRTEQNYDADRIGDLYGNRATRAWNPRGCGKGYTMHRRVYGPYRLKYPIVRKGWKAWADAGFPSLSGDPAAGDTSIMMGIRGRGVVTYHWKSDWQSSSLYDVDEAYPNMYGDLYQYSGVEAGEMPEATDYLANGRPEFLTAAAVGNALADPRTQERIGPVQKMRAEGFGTIEPHDTQDGQGLGVWKDGAWKIIISLPRRQANFSFEEGAQIPMGFAVWDGSRDERNGQKAFSDWQETRLGPPIPGAAPVGGVSGAEDGGGSVLFPVLGGVGGAIAVAVAGLIGLRMRGKKTREQKTEE